MTKYLKLNLQLFADGGAGGPSGTAAGVSASTDSMSSNDGGQLVTDNQDSVVNTESATDAMKDKGEVFKSLIKGEYKDEYKRVFEEQMNKRMKSTNAKIKGYEDQIAKINPALEKFAIKYGLSSSNDIDAILSAIDNDNSFYEEYAMTHNVSVEQAKVLVQAERITRNEEERKANEAREQAFKEKFNGWVREAETLKSKFPNFDFDMESQNENFRRLLNAGVDMESAYSVIHRDEIVGGAMAYTYNQAKQDFADNQRSGSNRPLENAISSQQTSVISDDITKLSKEQNEKIKAAVRRGEKVTPDNFRNYL